MTQGLQAVDPGCAYPGLLHVKGAAASKGQARELSILWQFALLLSLHSTCTLTSSLTEHPRMRRYTIAGLGLASPHVNIDQPAIALTLTNSSQADVAWLLGSGLQSSWAVKERRDITLLASGSDISRSMVCLGYHGKH
jgi:hypothetical protein